MAVAGAKPKVKSDAGRTRVLAARRAVRVAKLAAAAAAVSGLGVFALLARSTHAGGVKRTATLPALAAPTSFVRALDTGLSPGSVAATAGAAQTVSGGS